MNLTKVEYKSDWQEEDDSLIFSQYENASLEVFNKVCEKLQRIINESMKYNEQRDIPHIVSDFKVIFDKLKNLTENQPIEFTIPETDYHISISQTGTCD